MQKVALFAKNTKKIFTKNINHFHPTPKGVGIQWELFIKNSFYEKNNFNRKTTA